MGFPRRRHPHARGVFPVGAQTRRRTTHADHQPRLSRRDIARHGHGHPRRGATPGSVSECGADQDPAAGPRTRLKRGSVT